MAKSFLVDVNLNQNEIQNGVVQNLPSDPQNPIKGQEYFNTTTNKFRVYNGTTWDEMGTGGGTVTSVTVNNATDGGLTVDGSPVTTAGTITLGHSNVLSSAQTTQGIYPIAYDKNGHITAAGTAFDPATKQNTISDLETIRSGAALGATALQSFTETDPVFTASAAHDITASDITTWNGKQDAISDLETIRSGAAAGATAVQPNELTAYAPLANPALTGTPTAPTAATGTDTTQIATTAFVQDAISDLEGSMHYKGTVSGGTLPSSNVKNGDTYKVAEAGTYGSQAAKVGDLFIAVVSGSTTTWTYVPSADDTAVTSITAGTGLTGGTITTTGTIALETSGVTAGTYQGITVDAYGRVTSAVDEGYTTNTGTVTSVSASNATDGGLTITGSPITTSGTISIGHTNVLANAQTTQAIYPIAIDKNGHISSYGSAVTLLNKYTATIEGDGTEDTFAIAHNLGTRDVTVQVYDASTYEDVIVDIERTSLTTVTIAFAAAPIVGADYRVVIIG